MYDVDFVGSYLYSLILSFGFLDFRNQVIKNFKVMEITPCYHGITYGKLGYLISMYNLNLARRSKVEI